MTISELKEDVVELKRQLEEATPFKERFAALEKSQAPEYKAIIEQFKKEAQKHKDSTKKERDDCMRAKKEADIFKAFIDGKIKTKDEMNDQLNKLKNGLGEFGVKLRKIKVTTTVIRANYSPTHTEGLSIKEIQAKFSGANNANSFIIKRDVEHEEDKIEEEVDRDIALKQTVVTAGFIQEILDARLKFKPEAY